MGCTWFSVIMCCFDRSQLPSTTKPRQPVWALPNIGTVGSCFGTLGKAMLVAERCMQLRTQIRRYPSRTLRYGCWSHKKGMFWKTATERKLDSVFLNVFQNISPKKIGRPKIINVFSTGWNDFPKARHHQNVPSRTWSDNATHLQGCKKLSSSALVFSPRRFPGCFEGYGVPKCWGLFVFLKATILE